VKYGHIANSVFNAPWAITEEMLETITSLLRYRMEGGVLSADEIKARVGAQGAAAEPRSVGKIAILPLFGIISQRMNLMTAVSGGTSTEVFGARFRQAIADPDVSAIIIEVDSPGGSIAGIEELANDIFAARGSKPIIAVVNPTGASAAYWIASAADKVFVAPGGAVGSVGVIAEHVEFSKAEEMAGIKTTIITAGRYKGEGHPSKPLADATVTYLQGIVDEVYGTFVASLARHRGKTEEEVKASFGQGRMLLGQHAKEQGMVDGIATLREVIGKLGDDPAPAEPEPEEEVDPSIPAEEEGTEARQSTQETSTEVEMDLLTEIRALLGIAEDADPLAAITSLQAAAKDIATGEKGEANVLRRELAAAQQHILSLESEYGQRILALEDRNRQKEAEYAVNTAIAQGRVAPKDKDIALKLALANSDDFAQFASGLRVDLNERGVATDEQLAELEPTADELKVAASMGVTREQLIKQKAADKGVALPK